MKKSTYKAIDELYKQLESKSLKTELKFETLDDLLTEAEEAFDQRTERWQESDAGWEERERLNKFKYALGCVNQAQEELEEAQEDLKSLIENAPEGSFN